MRLLPLLALLLLGCPRSDPAAVPEAATPSLGGTLVIGVFGPRAAPEAALASVRAAHPGLSIRWVDLPSSGLGPEPVDLVLARDAAQLEELGDALQASGPHPEVAPPFPDPAGRWVALGARARVLLARRLLANPPTGIVNLAEPRFAGQLARPPALFVDGLVEALLANRGEQPARDLVDGLAFNQGAGELVLADSAAVVQAVFSKAARAGVAEHDAVHRHLFPDLGEAFTPEAAHQAVSESPVLIVLPDADTSGVAWTASAAGIAAEAPHPDLARAVITQLLTPEGQNAWARATREYPVTADAPALLGLVPPDQFTWSAAGPAALLSHAGRARELVEAAGLR